jgi:hypothetical protein
MSRRGDGPSAGESSSGGYVIRRSRLLDVRPVHWWVLV